MRMPPHRCPSCSRLVTGECPHCRQARAQAVDRRRLNSSQRGYGSKAWRRFRAAQLALDPFCAECVKAGQRTLATDVDHIIPVVGGPRDPRFLDFRAVQSLCHAHHSQKTALEDSTFVRRPHAREL